MRQSPYSGEQAEGQEAQDEIQRRPGQVAPRKAALADAGGLADQFLEEQLVDERLPGRDDGRHQPAQGQQQEHGDAGPLRAGQARRGRIAAPLPEPGREAHGDEHQTERSLD
ncbi:MAG: hypothetical protein B6D47_13180 [Rhodocyclaceae bacterium UTPRO2]|nr:MAG: hypothetical protein B6D47_13180 [Rhodocyclaceae bacterium UTPRO2]